jgi:hypothetical protein
MHARRVQSLAEILDDRFGRLLLELYFAEQRVIVKFLTNEFVDAHEIHTRLSAQFNEQTDALRTIQCSVRERQRGRENLHDECRSGRSVLD